MKLYYGVCYAGSSSDINLMPGSDRGPLVPWWRQSNVLAMTWGVCVETIRLTQSWKNIPSVINVTSKLFEFQRWTGVDGILIE